MASLDNEISPKIKNLEGNELTEMDVKKLYKPTNKELFVPFSGFDYIDRIKEMEKGIFGEVSREFHEKYTKRNLLGIIHGLEILALNTPTLSICIYELLKN